MSVCFPNHTPAEVAAIYNDLVRRGLYKLAAYVLFNYANHAPSDVHFGEFFNLIGSDAVA